jgi:putative membrane protein
MVWAAAWALGAPLVYELSSDERVALPFPIVGTLAAALAIFIAFRNNTAFSRWNEARTAWQNVLIASRVLARQVVASTHNAVESHSIDRPQADAFRKDTATLLITFAWLLARRTRPTRTTTAKTDAPGELMNASNPPLAVLVRLAEHIKTGIRTGALGQFDPISLEPQLVALNQAQGIIERIATTPTLRQYDYFTRRGVQLLALLLPFATLSLVPTSPWLAAPLAFAVSATFIVMAVTGAANDEPFVNAVTDVPIDSICTEVEHDVASTLGGHTPPPLLEPVNGYLW